MPIILVFIALLELLINASMRRRADRMQQPEGHSGPVARWAPPNRTTPMREHPRSQILPLPMPTEPYASLMVRWGMPQADAEWFMTDLGLCITRRNVHQRDGIRMTTVRCADTGLGRTVHFIDFAFTERDGLCGWSVIDTATHSYERSSLLSAYREHRRRYYRSNDMIDGIPTHRTRWHAFTLRIATPSARGFVVACQRHRLPAIGNQTTQVQP